MYRLQRIFSTAIVLLAMAALVACDSGVDPTSTTGGPDPTVVTFSGSSTTVSERDSVVTIEVVLQNSTGSGVTAELLYAAGSSSATIDDFNFENPEPVGPDSTAFVIESLDFSDGDTETFTYVLTDTLGESDPERGVFALQNVNQAVVGNAIFEVNISAEGTVELFTEDFSNDDLGGFEFVDVAGAENWETSSAGGADNAPYAAANAFQGAASSNEPSDDWLITPGLNFESFQSITLSFLNATQFEDGGLEQALSVLVSTDYTPGTDPTQSTWIDVTDRATYDQDTGEYIFTESGPVDLSDSEFVSASTHVAFRYQSSGTGAGDSEGWEIDNIVITGEE